MNEQMRSFLVWIIIGLIAGWLVNVAVGGEGDLAGYIIAGLIGAVAGGFLARQLDLDLRSGSPLVDQIVSAFFGAIIVLVIAGFIG